MTRPSQNPLRSRRALLGALSGAGVTAVAGCLGTSDDGNDRRTYEPQELSDPPSGSPGELYYTIEERIPRYDITVESVYENDGDLLVSYRSDAENALDADELANATEVDTPGRGPLFVYSMEEAGAISQAFNEICVKHGAGTDYELFIGEIANSLSNQPRGWGARTEWFESYNAGEMSDTDLQLSLGQNVVYEDDATLVDDDA